MSVSSTKGLNIWMTKKGVTPTSLTPTAISKAKPAEVTVANTLTDGQLVYVSGTGFPEIDGKTWVVSGATSTKFSLQGSDTTGSAGTLGTTPKVDAYATSDVVKLCLAGIDIAPGSSNTISIGTFCDPAASLPGNPTPGSVTLSGYVDTASTGYAELLEAESDGTARHIKIDIPSNGFLLADIVIGSVSFDVPLEGAVGYSFSASLSSSMRHVW